MTEEERNKQKARCKAWHDKRRDDPEYIEANRQRARAWRAENRDKANASQRERNKRTRENPELSAKQKEYMRDYHAAPEYRAKKAERRIERRQDTEYLEAERAYHRQYAKDHRDHLRELINSNPERLGKVRRKIKQWVADHPERRAEIVFNSECKAWERDPKLQMVKSAKYAAKKKGVPFDLTVDDFEIPELCPVLGMKLKKEKGKRNNNSPSLDRIIPKLGYVAGNVNVISWLANRLKYDCTDADVLQKVVDYIRRNSNKMKEAA